MTSGSQLSRRADMNGTKGQRIVSTSVRGQTASIDARATSMSSSRRGIVSAAASSTSGTYVSEGTNERTTKAERPLRERAEAAWQVRHQDLIAIRPKNVSQVHELEVHQIELELQNQELRHAQQELEESHRLFSDLYDFAPVGYVTINQGTVIVQANLTAAAMLRVERDRLVGRRFTEFVGQSSKDAFYLARRAIKPERPSWSGELVLRRADGEELSVSLEMVDAAQPDGLRLWRCVLSDITNRKNVEEVLRRLHQRAMFSLNNADIQDVLDVIVETAITI